MTIKIPSITYNWEEYLLGNEYTAGTGISITDNEISNDWVLNETVVSGDTWTTYTIKVANSDPTSWTPATTITFVV